MKRGPGYWFQCLGPHTVHRTQGHHDTEVLTHFSQIDSELCLKILSYALYNISRVHSDPAINHVNAVNWTVCQFGATLWLY